MSEPKQIEIDINRKVVEEMLLRLENTNWPPIVGEDSWGLWCTEAVDAGHDQLLDHRMEVGQCSYPNK